MHNNRETEGSPKERMTIATRINIVAIIIAAVGVIAIVAWHFLPDSTVQTNTISLPEVESNVEGKSSNPADYPSPMWADDKRDETYVLASELDLFWADVIKAPFPLSWSATNVLSTDIDGEEVTVIGGYARNKDSFPMTCNLPDGATIQQFGAKVDNVDSYMLLEYINKDVPGDPEPTVPNQCKVGTLFVPPVGMVFE